MVRRRAICASALKRRGSAAAPADHGVRLMTVEAGRRVLRAATLSFLDIAVTRANETMIPGMVVFVGRAV